MYETHWWKIKGWEKAQQRNPQDWVKSKKWTRILKFTPTAPRDGVLGNKITMRLLWSCALVWVP